jgi:undecaprenyl-diphosphatase
MTDHPAPSGRRWLPVIIATALAVLGLLTWWEALRHPFPLTIVAEHLPVDLTRCIEGHPLNIALFRLVNDARLPLLDMLAAGMSAIQLGWMLLVVFALTWRFRPAKIAPLVTALLIETALVIILKHALPQPRPAGLLDDVYLIRPFFTNSLPSGDVALAAVLAGVLGMHERPSLRLLLWGFVAIIAWERLYIGVHFPLDCLAGLAIGALSAFAGTRKWPRPAPRQTQEREATLPIPTTEV